MLDLEQAARIATASDDPGCPLRLIVERMAEGERKARKAEALRELWRDQFGKLGLRGEEIMRGVLPAEEME